MGNMGMCHSWFMRNFLFLYSWLRHSYWKNPIPISIETGIRPIPLSSWFRNWSFSVLLLLKHKDLKIQLFHHQDVTEKLKISYVLVLHHQDVTGFRILNLTKKWKKNLSNHCRQKQMTWNLKVEELSSSIFDFRSYKHDRFLKYVIGKIGF